MGKPLYIFDLDGTLANADHRLHHITGPEKDWRAFFAAAVDDEPIAPVVEMFKAMRKGAELWIWTGRSDEVREQTRAWLGRHGLIHGFWGALNAPESLLMRKSGDHRHDHVIKREWLDALEPPERNRLMGVFEDRSRVVQMWREAGVQCFQVAPGDF